MSSAFFLFFFFFNGSTQRAIFEIVSYFTAFGLKWIPNYFKSDNDFYLLNGFILNLPARNTENIMPDTLHKFASRIKHSYPEILILGIVWKSIFLVFAMYILYTHVHHSNYAMLLFNFTLNQQLFRLLQTYL